MRCNIDENVTEAPTRDVPGLVFRRRLGNVTPDRHHSPFGNLMLKRTSRLADITPDYDVVLCDVWGVVHNGARAFPQACEALAGARKDGKTVILLTNSPRPWRSVERQVEALGVPKEAFDRIVTSGDVTRKLIAEGPSRIFFLGPERDHVLLSGLDVDTVDEEEAEAVLCTGLFDDETEGPEDYRALLERFHARKLPLICANPDMMVERGDKLVYCAGALAALYAELGGETRISGKPYRPIYEAAMAIARSLSGSAEKARTLAVGDGIATDVKGAQDYGLDVLYIGAGIHARNYGGAGALDENGLEAWLAEQGATPRFWMQQLA